MHKIDLVIEYISFIEQDINRLEEKHLRAQTPPREEEEEKYDKFGFLNSKKKGVIIRWGGEDGKTDEKSRNLPPKLCEFRRIRTVLKNSRKSKNYFHKKGGHNKRELVVKNPIFGKYRPPTIRNTRVLHDCLKRK